MSRDADRVQAQPPLTNRGVLRPDPRVCGGVDWLALTVWAAPEDVQEMLERGVLDQYGYGDDPEGPGEGWVDLPAGGRVVRVREAGGLQVVEFCEEVTRGDVFCQVQVRGSACERIGNDGVQRVLRDLSMIARVRASRVDVMAHTEAFTPRTMRDAAGAGSFNSRALKPDHRIFVESPEGDTCYLGYVSKPKGGMKAKGDRCLRAYDRRGPTRIELQLRKDYAAGAAEVLAAEPVASWPTLIRGMIRHYVDFVDRDADPRPTRCPLLPWWSSFVEQAEKIGVRRTETPFESTAIGKVDGTLQRHARWLYAAFEAYGDTWILSRIRKHGKAKQDLEHADRVQRLRAYLGSRLADVPDRPDEIPF